jgi:aminoglycoside phosphotransferase family enzyme
MNDDQKRQPALVQSLRDPARYPHPAGRVELIETHISYVLLAGHFAYKLKKAIDLGFLDFSTLERRRFFCEEELRLNGRLAPDLYLSVASVTGSPEDPAMEGAGSAIEYAVKMRRFDQANLLNHLLERGELTIERVDEMADRVAAFHQSIPAAGAESDFGDPHVVIEPMRENLRHLEPLLETDHQFDQLRRIRQWTEERFKALNGDMVQRKASGTNWQTTTRWPQRKRSWPSTVRERRIRMRLIASCSVINSRRCRRPLVRGDLVRRFSGSYQV